MPDLPPATEPPHTIDVLIAGGGIAGLWLLNLLTRRGYSALLLEADALGCGQTLASQGMIHGGIKYALAGALTRPSDPMTWNPSQYLQYAGERLRPAVDLLARVPLEKPRTIVDLGCGAGNVTKLLVERWPDAAITGVDNDPAMLARARETPPSPKVAFVAGEMDRWAPPAPVDLVYSNAALHWLVRLPSRRSWSWTSPRGSAHWCRGRLEAAVLSSSPMTWFFPPMG